MSQKPQLIIKVQDKPCFSEEVKRLTKAKQVTQAMLAERSQLSKTTISRIFRNSDDKGSTYRPANNRVVFQLSVGLGLSSKEHDELQLIAFPEEALIKLVLDQHLDIYQADEVFTDNGCSPLLNIEE